MQIRSVKWDRWKQKTSSKLPDGLSLKIQYCRRRCFGNYKPQERKRVSWHNSDCTRQEWPLSALQSWLGESGFSYQTGITGRNWSIFLRFRCIWENPPLPPPHWVINGRSSLNHLKIWIIEFKYSNHTWKSVSYPDI